MLTLNNDCLNCVLNRLNALELRAAACACCRVRDAMLLPGADHRRNRRLLCVMTSASTNEVVLFDERGLVCQRFKALPPRSEVGEAAWPTCVALGTAGEIFVSQYRCAKKPARGPKKGGVLQFTRCAAGYRYQRAAVRCGSPEGIVCAHGCIYLTDTDVRNVQRILLGINSRSLGDTDPFCPVGDDVDYTCWGMASGPDGHLYMAAHPGDNGNTLQPTAVASCYGSGSMRMAASSAGRRTSAASSA